MADRYDLCLLRQSKLLCNCRKNAACTRSGGNSLRHQPHVHIRIFEDFLAPFQRGDIKSHRSRRQRIINLRISGQTKYNIILHQKCVLCFCIDFRSVAFHPHQFWNTVHFMRFHSCNRCDCPAVHFLCQLLTLLCSARIRIEHCRMQRYSFFIGQDKCLAETGHADSGNIRVGARHLFDDGANAFHNCRGILQRAFPFHGNADIVFRQ